MHGRSTTAQTHFRDHFHSMVAQNPDIDRSEFWIFPALMISKFGQNSRIILTLRLR